MQEQPNTNTKTKTIWILLGIVVVVALIFFLPGDDKETVNEVPGGSSDIVVNEVDLGNIENPEDSLPAGFPSDIPIEVENIVESYSSEYGDRGYTQHTVGYETTNSMEVLHGLYEAYITAEGYEVVDSVLEDDISTVTGKKENSDISVVIVPRDAETIRVTVNYLER